MAQLGNPRSPPMLRTPTRNTGQSSPMSKSPSTTGLKVYICFTSKLASRFTLVLISTLAGQEDIPGDECWA